MGRKRNVPRTILLIAGSIAAILYGVFLIGERAALFGDATFSETSVYLLFLVFLSGYYFLWKNEIVSGIILVVWHGLQWALVWWVWTDGAMTLILGVPIAVFGVIVLVYGIGRKKRSRAD